MTVTVMPSSASGKIQAPPSKSMAHRLLLAAGLAEGKSTVENLSFSEDILATIDCLKAMGATVIIKGTTAEIIGCSGKITSGHYPCRECGTTLRFFIPIAALANELSTFTGSERLLERPLTVYEEIFSKKNLPFHRENGKIAVGGRLQGGNYTVKGNISSQFISGLLFALPLLAEDSKLTLTKPIESRPYLDLTLKALNTFGVNAAWQSDNEIMIPGNQRYQAGCVTVEGDYSNAAFLEAFTALGDPVTVEGLSSDSLQGDRVYREYFTALKQTAPTLSLADCPDLGPILMAMAALMNGAVFTDTKRLAIKESNRGAAMAEELKKCGAVCHIDENTVTVEKSMLHAPKDTLSGHNDHRIVMALSVLLTRIGGTVDGAEAIAKSYPDFFKDLEALHIPLQIR